MLAHPICLCLAMIVHAVHVSKGYCRWIWWGLGSEHGLVGENVIKFLLEFYYAFGLSCKSYIMRFEHFYLNSLSMEW